jgi:hypothetical protein
MIWSADWTNGLLGGVLVGISVSLMLLLNGRVTGISGIVGGALSDIKGGFQDGLWRWGFVLGLFVGGMILTQVRPESFSDGAQTSTPLLVLAGFAVGFGTLLGSGCTSGHGVCGLSRFSIRSLVATLTFMSVGVLAVVVFRQLGWLTLGGAP